MVTMSAPQLEGDALRAVQHRGSHLQIIAAAGSGKTEVVSQRVASLLAAGESAEGIVAFTFTERAAAELRHRIAERAAELIGREILDQFGGLFVGTIHSYCFQLLQTHVPRYETYDVLDDKQLTAFLTREARNLDISDEAVLADLLQATGHPAEKMLENSRSQAAVAARQDNTQAAIAADAIGAPAYVYKNEVFWGQDRLELLEAMISSGRPAFSAT